MVDGELSTYTMFAGGERSVWRTLDLTPASLESVDPNRIATLEIKQWQPCYDLSYKLYFDRCRHGVAW